MKKSLERLSVFEKIGYSLGDLAANLIFQTLITFLAFFYTDVYGISANKASAIMLVGGLMGAFASPVIGMLADRTRSRWGKFRPWILFTSVPFGVIAMLTFTTPDLGPQAKWIYAFVTYILLVIIYSANNVPYAALSGVLTGNMSERNSISAYRFVAVMIAQFVIQVLLLPLVLILGDGSRAQGFQNAMTLFSIIGVVFFLITFVTTRERVLPHQGQKSTILLDLTDLAKNRPWLIMLSSTILVFMALALKSGAHVYYFEQYLNEAQLSRFLNDIGFNGLVNGLNAAFQSMGLVGFRWPEDAPTSALSLFNGGGIICMMIGIGFSRTLADRFGKRDVFGTALIISTLFILVFFFFPPDAIGLVFLSQLLHGFFYGITIPLLWAMIADVADYSEWKNDRRATAIIFSAMVFGLKTGLSIGGALLAAILGWYGYEANVAEQAPTAIQGIRYTISIYAALPFLTVGVLLFFYQINKPMEIKLEAELAERRKPREPEVPE